jgi:hypothetical protein
VAQSLIKALIGMGSGPGGGNFTATGSDYDHVFHQQYSVPPGQTLLIVPPTEPNPRRVILYSSAQQGIIWLAFGEPGAKAFPLLPGKSYLSEDSGGSAGGIWAIADTEGALITVTVLSKSKIEGSTEMAPIPLKVRGRIPTGQNKIQFFSNLVYPETFKNNFARLFDADSGATGYKAFELSSFQPLTNYVFNVAIAPGLILEPPIQIFCPSWDRIAASALELHAFEPSLNALPSTFIGNVVFSGWVANVNSNGQFAFQPEWGRHIGGICAKNPNKANYSDFLAFDYNPSTQTFTLLGF